ncbi:MAG: TonB-dependent siderophore receptor [Gammaproteobacteria bacterium]
MITVTGSVANESHYNAKRATSATKTDTPVFDTPASIQVVPKAIIDDQHVVQLRDALRNVSGVYPGIHYGTKAERFIVRGFEQSFIYRNGFRLPSFYGVRETSNLDRVEVLKGPAAMLYGRIEPGGLINVVTSAPLAEPYYSLAQEAGSFNFFRTVLGATGPLFHNEALAYRVDGSYTNSGYFRDFPEPFDEQSTGIERGFVAPSLTWNISDRTRITFEIEYLNDSRPFDRGLIALNGKASGLPIDRRLDDVHSFADAEQIYGGLRWSHEFNDSWRLNHIFGANISTDEELRIQPRTLQADGRTLTRDVRRRDSGIDIYYTALDLTGRVDLWGMEHALLVGGDYYRDAENLLFAIDRSYPSIDIFNPAYGLTLPTLAPIGQAATFNSLTENEWFGVYFQDQITLRDNLQLLGGGRYDWATNIQEDRLKNTTNEAEDEAFSPRVGLVYQPAPWLALYGNFTESLGGANRGTSVNGAVFEPETATQYEAGLKVDTLGGRLSANLAFYELTKQNILTPDLANPFFSVQIGEARSQGIEIDLTGDITPSWSVIATYALTETEIQKDNGGAQGKELPNVPRHGGSLWSRYQFPAGDLKGVFLGAGVFLQSERFIDKTNTAIMPGYGRVDLLAGYEWKVSSSYVTAQLNVLNLLDKEYAESSPSGPGPSNYTPGASRSFIGSLRIEF